MVSSRIVLRSFSPRHAEETGQPDIGKAWDIATISSRILKTSILAVTVTAIGIAILSIGNPVALVANVTDWWVDKPALQPDADPATSTIQTIAGTQDLPTTTTDAPPRDEIAAAVEPADPSQAETAGQRQAEGGQRQARTASQSLPTTSRSLKIVQAIPGLGGRGRDAETGRARASCARTGGARCPGAGRGPRKSTDGSGPCKMHAQRSGPSEIIEQGSGREQDARGQVPPVADPRAQDPSMQNAQTPSLLQSLGFRN